MTRLLGFLTSLFRRDGAATILKIFRHAFSPKAWRWLLENLHNRRIVKASGLVDEDWYRREYPDVAEKRIDPVLDFLTLPHPWMRLPNPDFVPGEYEIVNFDVKASGMQPAIHYASNGIRESRPVSTLEHLEKPFPSGTVELRREFPPAEVRHRRTAIFASFSANGRIKETVLYYLHGLREVADNIVFVANNPVFPDEVAKLEGIVRIAIFHHHGCYDFGSYKAGWFEAKAFGLLAPNVCDELVVCNDSCYGPVFPFSEVFDEMARRRETEEEPFDFWGMSTTCQYGRRMVPSYFYVFGPAILEGPVLDRWFKRLEPYRNRGQVVVECESKLTDYLLRSGYLCDGLVPESFHRDHRAAPTKCPLSILRDYRDPLVKVKTLRGDSFESLDEVYAFLRDANPELAALLPPPNQGEAEKKLVGMRIPRVARERHVETISEMFKSLRRKTDGSAVKVLFLTLTSDGFSKRSGFRELFHDSRLRCSVVAVPDKRLAIPECYRAMRRIRSVLLLTFPGDAVQTATSDSTDEWPDLASEADVVCWETAEDVSDFHYNPHWAVGRRFLPVLFFDSRLAGPYPREKEFGRQNYAYFWKVFFDNRSDFDTYAAHSIRGAENAVLVDDGDVGKAFLAALFPPDESAKPLLSPEK